MVLKFPIQKKLFFDPVFLNCVCFVIEKVSVIEHYRKSNSLKSMRFFFNVTEKFKKNRGKETNLMFNFILFNFSLNVDKFSNNCFSILE